MDKRSKSPAMLQEVAWDAPPAYSLEGRSEYGSIRADCTDDGRIDMKIDTKSTAAMLHPVVESKARGVPNKSLSESPALNIVIQIVGSRGDVQPFIALGQRLQAAGHRVRVATHGQFESFVRSTGLEFFNIGGDPARLMAYMVKNPSIIPSMATMKSGEIGKKRKMIYEMLNGCWQSCIAPDSTTNVPFVADAIIANPPSFAHIHCAQALGVPVHMMFTMPWSPTRAFPHPLANVRSQSENSASANYLSYRIVDTMTWQGLGDVINLWRRKILGLEAVSASIAPRLAEVLEIPFTYCWSPALVPKPSDWPSYIDVCGFFFRESKPYTPDAELAKFLRAGPPPIYVGFGSIVMEDPEGMTDIIISAVKSCGVRAIVSKGWSKLGTGRSENDILFLGDCPHEWLFMHVAAVIHHGGAGTTACGLSNGRPTAIVPFFGDQPFWANMVAHAGAGPAPVDHRALTSESLSSMIRQCLEPRTLQAAAAIADRMRHEDGVGSAAQSFLRNLPVEAMTCDLIKGQKAVWVWSNNKGCVMKLSDLALHTLINHKRLTINDVTVYKPYPIRIENPRWDPLTASGSAIFGAAVDVSTAISGLFVGMSNEIKKTRDGDTDTSTGDRAFRAAGKASRSVAEIGGAAIKASFVDYPLALVDGLDGVPALLGGQRRKYEEVTDWRSGARVAGKKFGMGFVDAFADLAMHPIRGAKKEGFAGFMKGIPAGMLGFVTTPAAGIFGLVAYPAQGVYKSVKTAYSPNGQDVLLARQVHGAYMSSRFSIDDQQTTNVLMSFDAEEARLKDRGQSARDKRRR